MIRESSVVIGMLAPFSGCWRGVSRHLLAGHSVRGARVVDVDELPSSVADSDGCRGDNEASRDSEGRHRWFSERQLTLRTGAFPSHRTDVRIGSNRLNQEFHVSGYNRCWVARWSSRRVSVRGDAGLIGVDIARGLPLGH
jgi:hypothetical protein